MVSAAEQLAANLNFGAFARAEDLSKRIWFTLGALILVRLGTYIPVPHVNALAFAQLVEQEKTGLLRILDHAAGGAVARISIFALYLGPCLAAAKIIEWISGIVPTLRHLKATGQADDRKLLNQYARYLTLLIAILWAYVIAVRLETAYTSVGPLVTIPGPYFRLTTMATLSTGAMLLMWIGEQITERGFGSGNYLIFITGIAGNLAAGLARRFEPALQLGTLVFILVLATLIALVACVVFIERAQRRLLVQYPKRQMGNRMFQGDASHLPLKLNSAALSPPVSAAALLILPIAIAQYLSGNGPDWLNDMAFMLTPGEPVHLAWWIGLIIFFAFFETATLFNPQQTADTLRKYGGFLPGIRPGTKTAEYIDYVLTRVTVVGAIYLSLFCVIPEMVFAYYGVPFRYAGIYIILTVTVTMEMIALLQGNVLMHQYLGLFTKVRLSGATRRSPISVPDHNVHTGISITPRPGRPGIQFDSQSTDGGPRTETTEKSRPARIRSRTEITADVISTSLSIIVIAMCALFPRIYLELVKLSNP